MADISGFLGNVVTAEDRLLFDEAVRSASANAPRAAYIMVWLSCAESLKRKFREMAPRDGQAARVVGEIARREAAHQSVDNYLLTEAEAYGLITNVENGELTHVYERRCVYGHPYEAQPTDEALTAAAEAVVRLVLSRPTRLRHGYLQEQVRLLTTDVAFLDDRAAAVEAFATIVRERAEPTLHLWSLNRLWAAVEPFAADPTRAVLWRRAVWFSRQFLALGLPNLPAGWDVVADLTRYPTILAQVLIDVRLFAVVGEHAQDIIVGHILTAAQANAAHLAPLETLDQAGGLTARQRERFLAGVAAVPPAALAAAGLHPRYFANRIIDQFRSYNWYTQQAAVEVLQAIGPGEIARLDVPVQMQLGNNVLQASEGNCRAASSLIADIARSPQAWPPAFVAGIIREAVVNDRNQIRFKMRNANSVVAMLLGLQRDTLANIAADLARDIQAGQLKEWWAGPEDRERLRTLIETHVAEADRPVVDPLINALNGIRFENAERR